MTNEELDDLVDRWHNGEGEGLELHEYLGMTWEEYEQWLTSPSPRTLNGKHA
jgi:hypothetical protein